MLDSYRDLIDELLGTPKALRDLLTARGDTGATPMARARMAELRDRDVVVLERLQTMLREPNPHLRPLPDGAEAPAATDEDVDALLATFDTARGELVSLLMNLTLKDWERTAAHETEGEIALTEEVERHVEFDEAHRALIQAAMAGS
jgi:hypothetical protein